MEVPDIDVPNVKLNHQEFCCFWCQEDREVPIGKVYSSITMPYPDIYELVWRGTCLGETIRAASAGEAAIKMINLAQSKNFSHVTCKAGYGVDTLYIPPYEE